MRATAHRKGVVQAGSGADIDDATAAAARTLLFKAGTDERDEAESLSSEKESVVDPLAVLASRCPQLEEIHFTEGHFGRPNIGRMLKDLLSHVSLPTFQPFADWQTQAAEQTS